MTAAMASLSTAPDAALAWARGHGAFAGSAVLTDRPWAQTLRLDRADGAAYLKILPVDAASKIGLLTLIADRLPEATPRVLAADAEAGFILYADHGGAQLDRRFPPDVAVEILTAYAGLQTAAGADLVAAAPVRPAAAQLGRLIDFLAGDETGDAGGPVGAAHFLGSGTAGRYHAIVTSAADELRAFLELADSLPVTLSHGDLRGPNLARRPDGALVFFDWDDAVAGAPGLSLHTFFSGCHRPWQALSGNAEDGAEGETAAQDRQLLTAYANALAGAGPFQTEEVTRALPAAISAGVMNYLVSYAAYPTGSERLRRTIGRIMRRRMSDLMDLTGAIVRGTPGQEKLAVAFLAAGRDERAAALTGLTPALPRGAGRRRSTVALPAIDISDQERKRQKFAAETRDQAAALFNKHGTLIIRNAIDPALVARCREDFLARYDRYFTNKKHTDALKVGDKRFMVSVEVAAPFNHAGLLAAPLVFPIIRQVLGRETILGSLTCVASLPGAADQRLHKDHTSLFKDQPDLETPSFAVTLIIPFIDLNDHTGGTRLVPGSHRASSDAAKEMPGAAPELEVGSCFLMDYRLSHQGLANHSDQVRPILSIVYQRPWFRDYVNYRKQKPLTVAPGALDGATPELRKMMEWAAHE